MTSLNELNTLMNTRTSRADELDYTGTGITEGDYECELYAADERVYENGRAMLFQFKILPSVTNPNVPANAGARFRISFATSDKGLDFLLRLYRHFLIACGYQPEAGIIPEDTSELVGKHVMARIVLNQDKNNPSNVYTDIDRFWAVAKPPYPLSDEYLVVSHCGDSVVAGVSRNNAGEN